MIAWPDGREAGTSYDYCLLGVPRWMIVWGESDSLYVKGTIQRTKWSGYSSREEVFIFSSLVSQVHIIFFFLVNKKQYSKQSFGTGATRVVTHSRLLYHE